MGTRALHASKLKKPATAKAPAALPALSRLFQALIIALIAAPTIPSPVGAGLDQSWIWGLNMAHVMKLHFGTQIIFTYGPLGYLAFPTFPQAEPWAVLALAWGVAAVTVFGLWQVIRFSGAGFGWLYLLLFWSASITLLALPTQQLERITIAAFAVALAIAVRPDDKIWLNVCLLYLLGAVGLLTKLNLGATPLLLAAFFTVRRLLQTASGGARPWRAAALCVLVFPIAFVALFWASTGTRLGIWSYLRSSREIVDGYSDAMAVAGPLWVVLGAAFCYVILFAIVPVVSGEFRRMAIAVPPLAIIAFSSFKSAMVRQDGHVVPFQFELALAALLMAALATGLRGRLVAAVFCIGSAGLGVIVQRAVWPPIANSIPDQVTGRQLLRNVQGFLNWRRTVEGLASGSEQQVERARVPGEIATLAAHASVMAYPYQIDKVRASGFLWRPLPVIQSYSAYTPQLDHDDANGLRAADAPDDVLLSWTTIDSHPFFYESPEAAHELLNWYDLQLATSNLDLLKRRKSPRFDPPQPAGETVGHWNQQIRLPSVGEDEILLVQTSLRENLQGVLRRELLRAPAIDVYATLAGGKIASGRIVRMTIPDGAIVSEWPATLPEVMPLFQGKRVAPGSRVVSLLFKPDAPQLLRSTFSLRWYRQKIRPAE